MIIILQNLKDNSVTQFEVADMKMIDANATAFLVLPFGNLFYSKEPIYFKDVP